MCGENALSHAMHTSDKTRLRQRETGEPPPRHEGQASVRVLPHKGAALQMGQPPSRSQVQRLETGSRANIQTGAAARATRHE